MESRLIVGSGDWGAPRGGAITEFVLADDGRLTPARRLPLGGLLSWLLIDGARLWAADEENGQLLTVDLLSTGPLGRTVQRTDAGGHPVHLAVAVVGGARFLLAAHYLEGRVTAFPLLGDGALLAECGRVAVGAQAHAVVPTVRSVAADGPAAGEVLVPCKGANHIATVVVGADGTLTTGSPVPQPGGPRHLVVHPTLPVAYGINELSVTVTHYRRGAGAVLEPVGTHDALDATQRADHDAAGEASPHTGSGIALSGDGRFLLTTQRSGGACTLSCWELANDGALTLRDRVLTAGTTPRHFSVVPGTPFVVVGNQDSRSLVVFQVAEDGGLVQRSRQPVDDKPFFVGVGGAQLA